MKPDLDAIRARCGAATPGPWRVDGSTYDEDCNEHLAPYGLEGPNERLIWSSGGGEYTHPDMNTAQFIAAARTDIPALLAYIDDLERDLLHERATFESCNRARQHCEHECATLKARTTYTVGETEWAQRIAVAEQRFVDEYDARKAAEREIAELKARIAVLEAMR